MEFLKLLSGGIKVIADLPFRAVRFVLKIQRFRSVSEWAVNEAGGELQQASGAKRFFIGLGKFFLFLLVVAAFAAALYGLWHLNRSWDLERQLGGPVPPLRQVWLPLLLLLFLGALLTGWWLWRLVGPLGEPTGFPDIRQAWAEARAAIEAAGLPLTDVPLFLVLGRPAAGVGSLFAASRLVFPVRGVPGRGDAPIQVYANARGVFVACPGASLLGRLADLLAAEEGAAAPPATAARTVFDDADTAAEFSGKTAADDRPAEALLLPDDGPVATAVVTVARPRRVPQLLQMTTEVDLARARLRYLGRLIAYHRKPFCGANGIVLLVPLAAVGGDAEAHQAAGACRIDVAAAREGLKTDCPVVGVGCDLEAAPGAAEFLKLIPEDRKERLFGQPFPVAADLPADKLPGAVADAVAWSGGALERLVLRGLLFDEGSLRMNADLYRFLSAVRAAQRRLGYVFGKAAVGEDGRPARYAGGFLAATGPDPGRDQAFVAGVFRLLGDNQNAVAWTPAARAEDAAYRTWSVFGYLGIGLFVLAVAAACYWSFWA